MLRYFKQHAFVKLAPVATGSVSTITQSSSSKFLDNLDVTFREDACKTRKGKAPENLAMLKRLAMNMVRKDQERYPKKRLRIRRVHALLDKEYLDYILSINFG